MPDQPLTSEPTTGPAPGASAPGPSRPRARVEAAVESRTATIIKSKIEAPASGGPVLTRPRLVGWLEQQRRARVILLSAEAGFGKSTLLADYTNRTSSKCIWYRLETSDADWTTFLSYLVAAVRHVYPGFGHSTEALLRQVAAMGTSRDVATATFLSDLSALGDADAVIILDDYHLVDGTTDLQAILPRLFERAPASMRFVIAGRGRPDLPLARITAQGRLAELTTSDLRFTRSEIEDLFDTVYEQPLAQATCDVVERRTEGWAASLQLVSASMAASAPHEVAGFIEALSGANGPIYDFLAEEILSRLPAKTQRVLVHASLLDRVTPELVAAALTTSEPVSAAEVADRMKDVETLGLLSRYSDEGRGVRLHPLLREFLAHHLRRETVTAQLEAMHEAIARVAAPTDWLVAGHHYALAGKADEAMQVLGSAAGEALGTGAWGAAAEVIESMPDATPPPAVKVLKARSLITAGEPESALRLLRSIDGTALSDTERSLVGLTRAAALYAQGDLDLLSDEVAELFQDASAPFPLRELAGAWNQVLRTTRGDSIGRATDVLEALIDDLEQADLYHYAGVTLHNAANAQLARARYRRAEELSTRAVGHLTRSGAGEAILVSTRIVSAMSRAESGDLRDGLRDAVAAALEPGATADGMADAAYLCAIAGDAHRAVSLLSRLERGTGHGARELPSRSVVGYAKLASHVARGELGKAQRYLTQIERIGPSDVDSLARLAVARANIAVIGHASGAQSQAQDAVDSAERQDAWRWVARARLLEAAARGDAHDLAMWLEQNANDSYLAMLEAADAIAQCSELLDHPPGVLEQSIVKAPERWVPVLTRQVAARTESSASAARLIARFGTIDDAPVLRDFDQSGSTTRRGSLARQLVRRVSPTVRVHDLGPTTYEIGNRRVAITDTRRKSASLLLYLVTCTGLAATRDQVIECLWPEQSPKAGLNSLHQTLFFLRRDIEPWYVEGSSANYVRLESDLVYLDPELFQIDSVSFARQSSGILANRTARTTGASLLRLYTGRFAPEFEYEEWAEEWRGQLHASYLHLAYSAGEALLEAGSFADAVDVLTAVTSVDLLAYELRAMLVTALVGLGSTDAAHAQYESMAALHSRDLGEPAPTFEELASKVGRRG